MFNWLKKIFMTENNLENTSQEVKTNTPPKVAQKPVVKPLVREFELAVYDVSLNENDKEEYRPVQTPRPITIKASTPQELKEKLAIFEKCGQKAKVAREITSPKLIDEFNKQMQALKEFEQQKQNITDQPKNVVQEVTQPVVQVSSNDNQEESIAQLENNLKNKLNKYLDGVQKNLDTKVQKTISKPRYFKVGNIQCKEVDGKIYQKQWMQATDTEAQNIRIVNSKTNAIVSLANKHIEIQKWILIEHSSENTDDLDSLEENLS